MRGEPDRFVIDTGIYVSAVMLVTSTPALAVEKAFAEATVLSSDASLMELAEVFGRRKFLRYTTDELRRSFYRQVFLRSEIVSVTSVVEVCRDPKDNLFLSLAIDGRANIVLTGDADLLSLHPFRNVEIISPANYLKRK
jgi:uncharacterized protein